MLYTPGAVLTGLVYGELPFMILPLYASLEKMDRIAAGSRRRSGRRNAADSSASRPADDAGNRRGDRAGLHSRSRPVRRLRHPGRRQGCAGREHHSGRLPAKQAAEVGDRV